LGRHTSGFGGSYHFLGELESGTQSLEAAVRQYKLALEEYREEVTPFLWAGTQFNLGNVERILGQRKNEPSLIYDALERHAAACRCNLICSPYWAFRAAEAAMEDMNVLKAGSEPTVHSQILAKHSWISTLQTKHAGHEIGLMPTFRVVVAGTSGTKKPDFSFASRRGDRIEDGTVIWENAGKYSYCTQCNEFLKPPDTRQSA
jgi:hypothetical protein